MIKFFRTFRKNQIKQSRPFRYLLYAIGEIILVVIGILIALQINNWNELRKAKKEEQEIVFSFKKELQQNIKKLKASSEYNRLIKTHTINVLNNLKSETLDTINASDIGRTLQYKPIQIKTPVLDEILKSDAKLISLRFSLISELRELNSMVLDIEKNLTYLDELYNSRATDFIINTGLAFDLENAENRNLQIVELEQRGYDKTQISSLINLLNALRSYWIDSLELMLQKSDEILKILK